MLCYAMLCYAMLCYAMLCYAMLCYAMLCYAMLCYTILYYAILYSILGGPGYLQAAPLKGSRFPLEELWGSFWVDKRQVKSWYGG